MCVKRTRPEIRPWRRAAGAAARVAVVRNESVSRLQKPAFVFLNSCLVMSRLRSTRAAALIFFDIRTRGLSLPIHAHSASSCRRFQKKKKLKLKNKYPVSPCVSLFPPAEPDWLFGSGAPELNRATPRVPVWCWCGAPRVNVSWNPSCCSDVCAGIAGDVNHPAA